MAFTTAGGYGNLPNGNFSSIIYSKKVQLAFRKSTVCGDITNSDYFGEIAAQGDTVKIIKEPEISVSSYARGTQVNAQDLDDEDFDDLRASEEFHGWVEEQPKWVQDALYENSDDPASVVRVIDLYKVDKGLTKSAKKAKAKDAASTVTKRTKTQVDVEDANDAIRESEVAKMSDMEFEERSDEINKAIRSGKFVYDVSGKAR